MHNRFILALGDLEERTWNLEYSRTGIVAVFLIANNTFCPPSLMRTGEGPLPVCAINPPQLDFDLVRATNSSLDLLQDSTGPPMTFGAPYVLDETLRPAIVNILQLVLAVVRIDLGNRSPNNFLTHPQTLNHTLEASFPETPAASIMPSRLYSHLQQQSLLVGSGSASVFDAFQIPGPSVVQTFYTCKLLKRKSAGNFIVSVFIATSGMFMTGWAVFIFVAHCIGEYKECFIRMYRWGLRHAVLARLLSR